MLLAPVLYRLAVRDAFGAKRRGEDMQRKIAIVAGGIERGLGERAGKSRKCDIVPVGQHGAKHRRPMR
jgi:hypothetical protein